MKRFLTVAAWMACLTLAPGMFAQVMADGETPDKPKEEPKRPERGQRGQGGPGMREVGRFLREHDKNADQKLDKAEFGNDKLFEELDTDKDGFLDGKELGTASAKVTEEGKRQAKAVAEEEFNALDKDSDKKLTAEELGETRKGYLESDADKSGSLNLDEYAAAKEKAGAAAAQKANEAEMKKQADERWKGMDKDGDGKLTGDEIPERMKGALDKIDTDKDGSISREEMDKASQGMRRQRGEGGQRPGREQPKKDGETPKKDEDEGGF
jgi:Ca2+-binding EF-hand superfamily protein